MFSADLAHLSSIKFRQVALSVSSCCVLTDPNVRISIILFKSNLLLLKIKQRNYD